MSLPHPLFIAFSWLFKFTYFILSTFFFYLDHPIISPWHVYVTPSWRELNELSLFWGTGEQVRRGGVTCTDMVTGDNVQHARSCGRTSMGHLSQHLQPVLMKNDRSHTHSPFVSHTFHTPRFALPPHMPGTVLL